MKEQDKTPEGQLSEVETGNLPNKEFRVMIVKMIQELRKRKDAQSEKLQEHFSKEKIKQSNRAEKYTRRNQQPNECSRRTDQ